MATWNGSPVLFMTMLLTVKWAVACLGTKGTGSFKILETSGSKTFPIRWETKSKVWPGAQGKILINKNHSTTSKILQEWLKISSNICDVIRLKISKTVQFLYLPCKTLARVFCQAIRARSFQSCWLFYISPVQYGEAHLRLLKLLLKSWRTLVSILGWSQKCWLGLGFCVLWFQQRRISWHCCYKR